MIGDSYAELPLRYIFVPVLESEPTALLYPTTCILADFLRRLEATI
jgi:hypothetical protein